MAKAEISWKRETPEGQRMEFYAQHVGDRWIFYSRERRVGIWLELLDSIRRRTARRLLRPEEVERVTKRIHELFPEADLS